MDNIAVIFILVIMVLILVAVVLPIVALVLALNTKKKLDAQLARLSSTSFLNPTNAFCGSERVTHLRRYTSFNGLDPRPHGHGYSLSALWACGIGLLDCGTIASAL